MSSISRTFTIDEPSREDIEVYRGSYLQIDGTLEDSAGAAVNITDARIVLTVYDIDAAADEFQLIGQAVTSGTWLANVVTFTAESHGRSIGDVVKVADCGNASYDGTYTVVSVPTADTFTAALAAGDPGAFTTNGQMSTTEIEVTTAASGLFSIYLTTQTDTDAKTYRYSLYVTLTGGTQHHAAEGRFRLLFSDYAG